MLKSKNKLLHKALAFVLTFSLLATLVSFNFTASAAGGDGTATSPYEISNLDDLNNFATDVNNGTFTNVYAKLTDSFSVDTNWTPIGNETHKFTGVFDGNGKTITFNNITVDNGYVGLFGINEGTIKNVTVEGSISSSTEKAFVGGVAGLNRGTITNCENNATINTTGVNSYAGGIAGVMQNGTIESCKNTGAITVTVSNNSSSDVTDHEASAGGIVAFNYNGTVKKCENTSTATIKNNETYGYTGGIVGNNDGTINNCLNGGTVSNTDNNGAQYAGGIAGNLFTNNGTGSTATISNCLNTKASGKVVGTNGTDSNAGTVANSYYLSTNSGENNNGANSVTNDQLKSGEVTYKLNGSTAANPVWGQTNLNNDNSLPVIGATEENNTIVYPNNDNGYTNDKPTYCSGEHSYKNGVCTKCFDVAAKVAGYSVTLDGTIGLNFYYDISNNITNRANEISYNKDTTKEDITGTANLTKAKEQTDVPEGYTRYVATVPVDSDQMNIDVVTTLQYDTTNNDSVVSKAYNVNKYLNTIYSDPSTYTEDGKDPNKLKTLVQTMSTYGYYANEYFDDYLPYEPSIPYYNLTVKANNLSDSKYDISYTGNGDGSLSHYASTLQYLEQVSGVFYVNNTNKIPDIYMQYEIIDIDETSASGTNTAIKPVVASNSIYTYAITEKVSIAELGQIKFAVTFGTKNGDIYNAKTNTKYYSPYTYVKNILTKYETANNTDNLSYKLTQALYHYSEAAYAYFKASSSQS